MRLNKAPIRVKEHRLTAQDIELAVANFFGIRENIIVPNVSWGLFRDNHEADMVVLRESGWADEVEIKVTAHDIKKDLQKHYGRGHARSEMIRFLWFAVPEKLIGDPNIPEYAGILGVYEKGKTVRLVRPAKARAGARKLNEKEHGKLLRLGCLRIWMLKRHLQKERLNNRERS